MKQFILWDLKTRLFGILKINLKQIEVHFLLLYLGLKDICLSHIVKKGQTL